MAFVMPSMRHLADDEDPGSFSNKLRARRFQHFETLAAALPRPLQILDIGGTNVFWEQRGWAGRQDVQITIVNLAKEDQVYPNIHPVAGDATDLREFADKSVDVVFSNSVIEHLFTLENQKKMAAQVQRVGRAFWVQTPNFWFPMEPHFHILGWQWMPVWTRAAIIRRRTCGWRGRCPDPVKARRLVSEVRLMTRRELMSAFPGATFLPEQFCGFVKSWIVFGGFPIQSRAPVS